MKKRGRMGATKFDEAARERFLEELAKTGRIKDSATCAGVVTKTVREHKKHNPEFAEAFEEAMEAYRDLLTAEIHRRAVEGVSKPIYQKGELVGYEQVYSDQLLTMQAKRHIPEYREKYSADVNVKGGVLVVESQSMSEADWLKKYGSETSE